VLKGLILAAAVFAAVPAYAQDFPGSQPIRIVVPYNPGGTTDLLARVVGEAMQRRMGHTVIIENRPGAATAIATDMVSKAAPDGHTLLMVSSDLPALAASRKNLPYDIDNFTYLSRFWVNTTLFVTSPNSGINSMKDLIDKIKAEPGKVKNGTYGVGGLVHLGNVKFEKVLGAKTVNVPYNGQGPASTDLLAGTIDYINGSSVPLAEGIKPLGPVGSIRHASFPDLPTLAELGYPEAAWDVWWGLIAPPNLPKPIADRLVAEIDGATKDPAVIEKLRTTAQHSPEKNPLTLDAFHDATIKELATWRTIAEEANLVVK
jgi:tripartite-type tricarboxylate transporter receptor subunit TctC